MKQHAAAPARDIVLATFDALRFDSADQAWRAGQTPFLRELLPQGWQRRHSPGSFTLAAHSAIFAGFWPTQELAGDETRPFALRFPGSRTVGTSTMLLEGSNIVCGLQAQGYQTICIGGVGFFNPATPLGQVFPGYFEQSYWRPEFSVSQLHSTREQVAQACRCLEDADADRPLLLFVNFSATHPPTRQYVRGAKSESVVTQVAALAYIDRHLPALFRALRARQRDGVAYLMSDHGTLFGEDGHVGHRVGHPAVWTVPYAEYRWERAT
jgi:hypothetical protein